MYSSEFYQAIDEGSRRSASLIWAQLLELTSPSSVVDVGCGVGNFLAEAIARGIEDVRGIDGDYVDRAMLRIPAEKLTPFDLEGPLHLERRFDLAASLEVAEHLPAASARTFVESLTRLSDRVLFSAAIPYQGGNNHINEAWQDFWAELFAEHDFVPIDAVRRGLWSDSNVEWWYAQNIVLYAARPILAEEPSLRRAFEATDPRTLRVVHPENYLFYRMRNP